MQGDFPHRHDNRYFLIAIMLLLCVLLVCLFVCLSVCSVLSVCHVCLSLGL